MEIGNTSISPVCVELDDSEGLYVLNIRNEGNAQKQLLSAVTNTLTIYCWHSMRTFGRRQLRQTALDRRDAW